MKTLFSKQYLRELWEILWSVEVVRYYAEQEDLLTLGAMSASANTYFLKGIYFRWDGAGFKYTIGDHKGRLLYKDQVMCMGVFLDCSREMVIGTGGEASKFARAVRLYYKIKKDAVK